MRITISGHAGAGKSTVAKLLASRLNLKHYSIGDLFRQIAHEKNLSIVELNNMLEKDSSIDDILDKKQADIGKKQDNFVIDGRLAALFIPHANFKAFLDADEQIRAERILKESRSEEKTASLQDAIKKIRSREQSEIKRYTKLYNFNCYDKNKYDIVINTTKIKPEEVVEKIIIEMEKRK